MTWFRLDDKGAFHAKVIMAGNEAYGAWTRAGQWSSEHNTNGVIPRSMALVIGAVRLWAKLVAARPPGHEHGLAEVHPDGWELHDFLDYNPSAEQVIAERERKQEAGKRGGLAKAEASRRLAAASHELADRRGIAGVLLAEDPRVRATPDPGPDPLEIPDSSILDESPAMPDRVREVFDHWLAGWQRVVGGKNPPKLSDPRRAKIRTRLNEGYAVDQIKAAIDACWASSYHVEGRYYDIELICRSSVKLDAFLAKSDSAKIPKAPQREVRAIEPNHMFAMIDRMASRPAEDK